MIPTPHHCAGETVLLDPAGILVWPRQRLLAVADLHLEKSSAGARRGSLLPPWDSAATLDRLAAAIRRHDPETVVAVGDSFHDAHGPLSLRPPERARLVHLATGRNWIWVAGNHDPAPPEDLPGEAAAELRRGPVLFRHEARAHLPPPQGVVEICGHHHPKANVPTRGGGVSRPCFVACATGGRLMLPAFGAYTGGLDVTAPAIARLFPHGGRLHLTGPDRLFSFSFRSHATQPA